MFQSRFTERGAMDPGRKNESIMEYRCHFTVIPATEAYKKITIVVKLTEAMALMLMATPVKGVDIAVERSGGMILDKTPAPLDFLPGG